MNWNKLDVADASAAKDAAAVFQHIKCHHKGFHLRHDLDWIRATHPDVSLSVFTEDTVAPSSSYALVFKRVRALPFHMGEIVWFRKGLSRYELWEGPVFADAALTETDKRDRTRAFLGAMHAGLAAGDAVSIEGLPVDGVLYDLIMHDPVVKRDYISIILDRPFAHQFIRLPETLDAYFGAMSGKTRRNLKYDQRKLGREFEKVEVVCYRTAESVDDFLDQAIPLSQKTYQWRLLDLGLRDRSNLAETFGFAAQRGWLRNYILFVDGQAVAFMLGYLYEGCYYYTDVGFDPDWSKWSVGSVLQMHVIEDLYVQGKVPTLFDFGTGYGYHKAQFGNHERQEVNLLLLPRTFANRCIALLYRLNLRVEAALVFILEKLRIKKALKKLIRRNSD